MLLSFLYSETEVFPFLTFTSRNPELIVEITSGFLGVWHRTVSLEILMLFEGSLRRVLKVSRIAAFSRSATMLKTKRLDNVT